MCWMPCNRILSGLNLTILRVCFILERYKANEQASDFILLPARACENFSGLITSDMW